MNVVVPPVSPAVAVFVPCPPEPPPAPQIFTVISLTPGGTTQGLSELFSLVSVTVSCPHTAPLAPKSSKRSIPTSNRLRCVACLIIPVAPGVPGRVFAYAAVASWSGGWLASFMSFKRVKVSMPCDFGCYFLRYNFHCPETDISVSATFRDSVLCVNRGC